MPANPSAGLLDAHRRAVREVSQGRDRRAEKLRDLLMQEREPEDSDVVDTENFRRVIGWKLRLMGRREWRSLVRAMMSIEECNNAKTLLWA